MMTAVAKKREKAKIKEKREKSFQRWDDNDCDDDNHNVDDKNVQKIVVNVINNVLYKDVWDCFCPQATWTIILVSNFSELMRAYLSLLKSGNKVIIWVGD